MIATLTALALAVQQPSVPEYRPRDGDERGLWMAVDEAEREVRTSGFVVRDAALNAYVREVLCRAVGADRCGAARIYIVRTPFFNASMAPNGMMQLWTGLLLRARNEAQLAAVLGHEFAHFERRHQLRGFRDARARTDAMAWLSFLPYGVGALAQVGQIGGYFANSRDMEREADIDGLSAMARGGYAPGEAARIWGQLREEQDATAVERRHRSRRDRGGGLFASHPGSGERMTYLAAAADAAPPGGTTRAAEYRAALAPWWAALIDDQIKLNDFGGTEYLLAGLARGGGWTSELLYARGELYRVRARPGDMAAAAGFYRQALAAGDAPVEAYRGLGLALLRDGAADAARAARAALAQYVAARPDAGDRAMIAALAGVE